MKSVLLSIKPKYCELITGGIKTIEVRKTKPKLDTPFKCYIYKTTTGKIIGEFVCDEIVYFGNVATDRWELMVGSTHEWYKEIIEKQALLTEKEMLSYGGKYGWHISDLKIYDTPKELSGFIPNCTELQNGECMDFKNTSCVCQEKDYNPDGMVNVCKCINRMYRPPQSWCYVEEVTE